MTRQPAPHPPGFHGASWQHGFSRPMEAVLLDLRLAHHATIGNDMAGVSPSGRRTIQAATSEGHPQPGGRLPPLRVHVGPRRRNSSASDIVPKKSRRSRPEKLADLLGRTDVHSCPRLARAKALAAPRGRNAADAVLGLAAVFGHGLGRSQRYPLAAMGSVYRTCRSQTDQSIVVEVPHKRSVLP